MASMQAMSSLGMTLRDKKTNTNVAWIWLSVKVKCHDRFAVLLKLHLGCLSKRGLLNEFYSVRSQACLTGPNGVFLSSYFEFQWKVKGHC